MVVTFSSHHKPHFSQSGTKMLLSCLARCFICSLLSVCGGGESVTAAPAQTVWSDPPCSVPGTAHSTLHLHIFTLKSANAACKQSTCLQDQPIVCKGPSPSRSMDGEAVPALTHPSCTELNSATGTLFCFCCCWLFYNHSISASKGTRHL